VIKERLRKTDQLFKVLIALCLACALGRDDLRNEKKERAYGK